MTFNIIELENWDRKEYFEHYFNQQTTYSITKEIDITLFKDCLLYTSPSPRDYAASR
ncbi:hypothetical protein I5B98_14995, partial [Staphylococcus aureus]|nr:hypothetical protein [Staphylococcus aureus]